MYFSVINHHFTYNIFVFKTTEQVEPEVQSEKLLTIDKLKTLPRVSEELFRCKTWYDRIKRNHRKIGIFLLIIEWILTQSASFVKTLSTKEDYSFLNRRSKKGWK